MFYRFLQGDYPYLQLNLISKRDSGILKKRHVFLQLNLVLDYILFASFIQTLFGKHDSGIFFRTFQTLFATEPGLLFCLAASYYSIPSLNLILHLMLQLFQKGADHKKYKII